MFPVCLLCSEFGSTNIIRFLNFCNFFLSIVLQYFCYLYNFASVIQTFFLRITHLNTFLWNIFKEYNYRKWHSDPLTIYNSRGLDFDKKFGQHFQQGSMPCIQQIRFSYRKNLLKSLPRFTKISSKHSDSFLTMMMADWQISYFKVVLAVNLGRFWK